MSNEKQQGGPKREIIPVKRLRFRDPIRFTVPGDSSQLATSGIAASETIAIEYHPYWRQHLVIFTPRPGSSAKPERTWVPESWCQWDEM